MHQEWLTIGIEIFYFKIMKILNKWHLKIVVYSLGMVGCILQDIARRYDLGEDIRTEASCAKYFLPKLALISPV